MRYAGWVLCCLLLVACGDDEVVDPVRALTLRTDQESYTALPIEYPASTHFQFRVAATITNHGREVVYLARCSPTVSRPFYYVVDANGDRAAYGPVVWGCSGDVPGIAVGPGESRTDTLTIEGPGVTVSETGSPIGAVEGGFRLV